MHILYVTLTFPPDTGWGGIGTYVYHMSRGMVARGHRVTVLCGYKDRKYEEDRSGLRIVRELEPHARSWQERSEEIAAWIESQPREHRPNVIEFAEYGANGVFFQRRNPDFPTVVKLHLPACLCALYDAHPLKAIVLRRFPSKVMRCEEVAEHESARRAHVVVSPSAWLMATLEKRKWSFPVTRSVVPNPIGYEHPSNLRKKDYQALEILWLARMDRLKGAPLVPAICREVWRQEPLTRFELIGQDKHRENNESWYEWVLRKTPPRFREQIRMLGGVPHAQIPEHLARHSVAVFASKVENFPYTVLESMDAGLACVVASGGGAHEVGVDGVTVLNSPRRASEIAARLVRLLRDPNMRQRMGAAAQNQVRAEFGTEVISQKMELVYLTAIERAGIKSL